MSAIILFMAGIAAIAGWWLSQQGLAAKPWLEEGVTVDLREDSTSSLPPAKLGLGVFLAVVGSLFALFISAYSMRMNMVDWRALPVPGRAAVGVATAERRGVFRGVQSMFFHDHWLPRHPRERQI
jgi:heme/copper-type cytochrome/quinol oxidase subunit 3